MLENLVRRIEDWVPEAIYSPQPGYDSYYYWAKLIDDLTEDPEFEEVEDQFDSAGTAFLYQEILALSDEDFLLLQSWLQEFITHAFDDLGQPVPEQIASRIIPGDEQNILIHEKEHLDVLPPALQSNAAIYLTFKTGDAYLNSVPRGEIVLDGVAAFDMAWASTYDIARCMAAPRSASETDKTKALYYAQKTQDEAFIVQIREKVSPVV